MGDQQITLIIQKANGIYLIRQCNFSQKLFVFGPYPYGTLLISCDQDLHRGRVVAPCQLTVMLPELGSFYPHKRVVHRTKLEQFWFAAREHNKEPLNIRLGRLVQHNDRLHCFIELEIVDDLCFTLATVASPNFKVILLTERTEHNYVGQVTNQSDRLPVDR